MYGDGDMTLIATSLTCMILANFGTDHKANRGPDRRDALSRCRGPIAQSAQRFLLQQLTNGSTGGWTSCAVQSLRSPCLALLRLYGAGRWHALIGLLRSTRRSVPSPTRRQIWTSLETCRHSSSIVRRTS
eukprot:m.154406 g.154406  ORF g.154406 m.154406 type:complete len:130 (+) comp14376_c0_seq11:359-748(+)